METLEQEIVATEGAISSLPAAEVRTLERTLRTLSPAQRVLAGEILAQARDDRSLPIRYLQVLEYFFEKWSSHSLPTKLVLINRLRHLADRIAAALPHSSREMLLSLFDVPECIAPGR